MSNEIAMDSLGEAFLNADLGLTDIYSSWFGVPVDDMSMEELQDIVFLHFRAAYLAGRIQGQSDIVPVVRDHTEALCRMAGVTRGE